MPETPAPLLRLDYMWKAGFRASTPSRYRGFSLTELLIVIAIILVAISIILTVLSAAMRAVRALKG